MKKKYNKPLTNTTMVRNEMGFCSSVNTQHDQAVKSARHKTGYDEEWDKDFGGETGDNTNSLTWE